MIELDRDVTGARDGSSCCSMIFESLLVTLAAIAQNTSSEPAPSSAQFTHAFATDSMGFGFVGVPAPFLLEPREQSGVHTTSLGLQLDSKLGSPTICVLRPWHLDGTRELFVSWNASVPRDAGLQIEARLLDQPPIPGRIEDASAWVCVGRIGQVTRSAAAPTVPEHPSIEAHDGYVRFDGARPYVQFRVIAFGTTPASAPVLLERVDFAGSNRDRVSTRTYPPRGGCSLGTDLIRQYDHEAHEQSHIPHPLAFVAALASPTISLEQATGIACLRMLLAPTGRDALETRIATATDIDSRSLPSWLVTTAYACGVRSRLECTSFRREAEALMHGSRPLAIRIVGERGRFAWAVLTSFDEHEEAVVYDPTAPTAEPRHWSWDELEHRWFGAGGLAIRIEG